MNLFAWYLAIGLLWVGLELLILSLHPKGKTSTAVRDMAAHLNLSIYPTITLLSLLLLLGWIVVPFVWLWELKKGA